MFNIIWKAINVVTLILKRYSNYFSIVLTAVYLGFFPDYAISKAKF